MISKIKKEDKTCKKIWKRNPNIDWKSYREAEKAFDDLINRAVKK